MGWLQMEESSCLPFLWPLPHCSMPNGSAEWLRSLETVISLRHKCGQGWPRSHLLPRHCLFPSASQFSEQGQATEGKAFGVELLWVPES